MDKNEILQKSRLENKDEGLLVAKNKGAQLGKRLMAGICILILLVSFIFEKRVNIGQCVVLSVFNCFFIGENIEVYRFTKKKSDLWAIILYSAIALGWFASFIVCLVVGE